MTAWGREVEPPNLVDDDDVQYKCVRWCVCAHEVSGAWNMLYGTTRDVLGAQDQHSALRVMRLLVQERIDTAVSSFQRMLGTSIDGRSQGIVYTSRFLRGEQWRGW